MSAPQPGQRLPISPNGEWLITLTGPQADHIAICAVNSSGALIAFQRDGQARWHTRTILPLAEPIEIVAYITDDAQGGFVNSAYPIVVEIAGESYRFPEPTQQLAAVILAEIYTKDGQRRAKVSNEGFTFGLDAYARARRLDSAVFPGRRPCRDASPSSVRDDRHQPRRNHTPGQQLGSGSGVVIGPNLIVTNAHVIQDGSHFEVGRSREPLTPLAVDIVHDLALLQGTVSGSPIPIRIGAPLWLGEPILVGGYPLQDILGSDLKVTTGNVSGLSGAGGDVARFQFTAPIGSGSSGGAIVDECGNLVGITSSALAHENMRDRGNISENVNFGVRSPLVFEMIAAAGQRYEAPVLVTASDRRELVQRLRGSIVSINVFD